VGTRKHVSDWGGVPIGGLMSNSFNQLFVIAALD